MSNVNITLSEEQREGTKATVSQWLYQVGEVVTANEPIVEIETDKVMMEIIAPATGKLVEIKLNSGEEVSGSTILGIIDQNNTTASSSPKTPIDSIAEKQSVNDEPIESIEKVDYSQKSLFISPSVRRLLSQHQVDLNLVRGTGKDGRVTSRDIEAYLKNPQYQNDLKPSQHIPISNMRKSIADHMVESLLHTAPHVTSVFNL
ncbi:MAG TPA: E3 binding domain-containing protein, partial [Gammaproteobacteria bacterium]|nr:E3 binding domain-containing protein [Gammaproteobacteria bacterium]